MDEKCSKLLLVFSIKENDESGEYYVGRQRTITSSGPELSLT